MKQIKFLPSGSWKAIAFVAAFVLVAECIFAQQHLPMIKAGSKIVDIRDGSMYQKGIWNLSPEVKPDTYTTLYPDAKGRVVFYTDLDSVSFDVVPGQTYDFLIILNDRDSCFTRISTIKPVKEAEVSVDPVKLISPDDLRNDFAVFRKAMENEHAGLYRYKNKKQVDKLFDGAFIAIDHSMTQFDFGKIIMSLISSIEDGHTGTNLSRKLVDHYIENVKLFPITLHFIKDKAYVLCSRMDEFPAETEILSVDQKPVDEILKEMFSYLPSDGQIETKKRHTINNGAFPVIYSWVFGNKESFSVTFKNKPGDIKTIVVQAEFVKDFECDIKRVQKNVKDLELEFIGNKTALLNVRTFDERRLAGKQNFRQFLDSTFNAIRLNKTEKLIVDIRGNAGGFDDYGVLLYSYLAQEPFRFFASVSSVKGKVPQNENPFLGVIQPQRNNFKGEVLFLINGLSFSATADFCAIAKSNRRGKFVGEETGGGYYGNNSGQIIVSTLPKTGIKITIPKFSYVNAVRKSKHSNRGVIPDYEIISGIHDVIEGKDVQLDFALKLIENR